jgi:hypothetical protein
MPLSPYTTDSLLTMLRLLPLMPSVQALFSDTDLVNIMDFEMTSKILPMIDNQAEEYFVKIMDIPYSTRETLFPLPIRATADKLRSVSFLDNNNNEVRIPRLRPEDIMSNVNATGLAINPALWGFYLQDNLIVLYLSSANGGSSSFPFLRLRFVRMPSTLVEEADCAQITAVSGNVITVNTTANPLPTTFTTTATYDIVSNSPQMFVSKGDDLTVTSIVGNVITFTSLPKIPSTLPGPQVGDWVCLAMQSPIPQIPFKPGFDLLLQLSAAKCLEIHGDMQGFNVAMSQAADMKNYFISVITPRVDANVIRLTTPNALYGWD